MKRSISIPVICGFMLLLALVSISLHEDENKEAMQDENKEAMQDDNEIYQDTTMLDENIDSFETQKVIANGIIIQVNNMVVSKGLPETVEKYKVCYFDENCDEEGVLENKYRYVFLDLTLQNKNDTMVEVYLNSMRLTHVDATNSFSDPSEEMRYRSGYDFVGICPKDYFRLPLEKNEIVDVTVGFIAEDTFFDVPGSCLRINITGNFYNPEIKAIRLMNEE